MNKGTVKWFNSQKDLVLSRMKKTARTFLFTFPELLQMALSH